MNHVYAVVYSRPFPLKRKILLLLSLSVALLSLRYRLEVITNLLSELLPDDMKGRTAFIREAKATIPVETESPMMVTASESGLMTMERRINHKKKEPNIAISRERTYERIVHFRYQSPNFLACSSNFTSIWYWNSKPNRQVLSLYCVKRTPSTQKWRNRLG